MSDGVLEKHGVVGFGAHSKMTIAEEGALIAVSVPTGGSELTPAEARYMANKLLRLALRVERRMQETRT